MGSLIVLNFHRIGKPRRALADGERDVCVEPPQFAEILEVVKDRDEVQLTFDDGNESDMTEALPELVDRGLHAEFFICAARFGTPEFVDEDAVRELHRAGMSIGSHGMRHVPWRRLRQTEIDHEIVEAKQILEATLQTSVDSAACPFGAYDRRTLQALRAAGYTRVYTSDGGRAGARNWLVPRNTVRRTDSADSIARMLDDFGTSGGLLRSGKRLMKQWR